MAKVNITSVTPMGSFTRVNFLPVDGAQDYDVVECSAGGKVIGEEFRAAGINRIATGSNPQLRIDVPSSDLNGLAAYYVVRALDRVHSYPFASLLDYNDSPYLWNASAVEASARQPFYCAGRTAYGLYVMNGQADPRSTVQPSVLAISDPVFLSSSPGAYNSPDDLWSDSFLTGKLSVTRDSKNDSAAGVMRTGSGVYDVRMDGCDLNVTDLFVYDGAMTSIVRDGGTPGASHQADSMEYGSLAVSPAMPFDISKGINMQQHATARVTGRQWIAWNFSPSGDPMTHFRDDDKKPVNQSNMALRVSIDNGYVKGTLFAGFNADGTVRNYRVCGASGQTTQRLHGKYTPRKNGLGVDLYTYIELSVMPYGFRFAEDLVTEALVDFRDFPIDKSLYAWMSGMVRYADTTYKYHGILAETEIRAHMAWEAPYLLDIAGHNTPLWAYQHSKRNLLLRPGMAF